MSAMVWNPAFLAPDSRSVSSGSWTQMNFRFHPFSALRAITACAVVPEPAKKSKTRSSGFVAIWRILLIKSIGLGVSNTFSGKIDNKSLLACCVSQTSLRYQIVIGVIPCFTSDKNRFNLGKLSLFLPKNIRLSSINSCILFLFVIQHLPGGN